MRAVTRRDEQTIAPDFAYRQMRRLLPGPYTFVLPATHEVPEILREGLGMEALE